MRPDPGQLVDQLGDGVGHAGPHRRHVGEVDVGHRLGRDGPDEGGPQPLGRDARRAGRA